jgi:hypothetical protein
MKSLLGSDLWHPRQAAGPCRWEQTNHVLVHVFHLGFEYLVGTPQFIEHAAVVGTVATIRSALPRSSLTVTFISSWIHCRFKTAMKLKAAECFKIINMFQRIHYQIPHTSCHSALTDGVCVLRYVQVALVAVRVSRRGAEILWCEMLDTSGAELCRPHLLYLRIKLSVSLTKKFFPCKIFILFTHCLKVKVKLAVCLTN